MGFASLQSWSFVVGASCTDHVRPLVCILAETPNPFPLGERLCMLGWLCIVQSPCAYTPGIRAGAILLGLPPLVPVGGYAPKQGCFGCLPKVLHDAKPAEQATLDTPFLYNQEVYRQSEARIFQFVQAFFTFRL